MAHQQESFHPLFSLQGLALSFLLLKPCGKGSPQTAWFQQNLAVPMHMAVTPGFKSRCEFSWASPFPTPPQSSTPDSIPIFLQLSWAALVSPGRCGPMAWSKPPPSSHAGTVTRGSCLPVTSWPKVTPISLAQNIATAI